MLANRSDRSNRPDVRAKWLRPTIGLAAILATALIAVFVRQFAESQARHSPDEAPARVLFVAFVDDASDERGRSSFDRLRGALRSPNAKRTASYSLDYVQVVVDGPQTIDEKLRELVESKPAVIVATSHDVLEAAKAATQSIPILFMSYADPVETGNVRSIAEPGVRRTGFTFHVPMLPKAVELLLDGYPATKRIGLLVDSLAARQPSHSRELSQARNAFPVQIEAFTADNKEELADVLEGERGRAIDAWYFPMGAAIWYDQEAVLRMMAATGKPVLYDRTSFVRDGGLMAYEARIADPFRIWASQLLLILHGVDAATIPIERPSEFELALNLDAIAADKRLRPSKNIVERANVLFGAE
jgi:putative ABC transport system substrate-binding protein